MTLNIEQAIGQKMLLSFTGPELPAFIRASLTRQHVGGITFFRSLGNTENPAQVRTLTTELQKAAKAAGQPPLLIGTDQEGGQLMAIGNGTTNFPGNLALGAIGSVALSEKVGHALGLELAAMGVNLNYAPACDVNSNPQNPVIGTRSFGEDAQAVGRLAAAMVTGLQSAGVAATAKHFPGHGDTASDSHHEVPLVSHPKARLDQIELPPFQATIAAGVKLVMTGHLALPALHEGDPLPATFSARILQTLLREELGFKGVTVTDAMDMGAVAQGAGLLIDTVASIAAGMDLLLLKTEAEQQQQIYTSLHQAVCRNLLSSTQVLSSAQRILALKQSLAQTPPPPLTVVGCAEHQALAAEVARRSITLVRDEANLLPLTLAAEDKIAVITPQPADLTPADTSSYITCALPETIRQRHPHVTEFIVPQAPTPSDIAALRSQAQNFDLIIVGTVNASTQIEQAALVNALVQTNVPLIAVALRMPYDLQLYPSVLTYLCSYSIMEPSMEALTQVLWGEILPQGRLPVSIPGLYPLGQE